MKKFIVPVLLIFTVLACEKIDQDPEYKFVIIVKTLDDSTRVQNAYVEIAAPTAGSDISFSQFTNENGEAHFEYGQDAVFRIRATRGENPYSYMGCSYVRLEPNETVYKTVYMEPYDPTFPGCDIEF